VLLALLRLVTVLMVLLVERLSLTLLVLVCQYPGFFVCVLLRHPFLIILLVLPKTVTQDKQVASEKYCLLNGYTALIG